MTAYYNENDPYAAAWLAALIRESLIPDGHVDNRSVLDVPADDLKGYTQCHFFAGIAGWSYALRLAGWPDDEPVWTGSCPCQPLSSAGQQHGHADERHLWPAFHALIAQCHPTAVLGEQVASKDGREWLAGVRADLEHLGYAVGAADLCAAGVGAPHIRQRLYWVANASGERRTRERLLLRPQETRRLEADLSETAGSGAPDRLADAQCHAAEPGRFADQPAEGAGAAAAGPSDEPRRCGMPSGLGVAVGARLEGHTGNGHNGDQPGRLDAVAPRSTASSGSAGPWSRYDLIACLDGKSRRTEPGLQPLAHGVPARVGRLRAYGNAIVPQVAAEFIRAWMETV